MEFCINLRIPHFGEEKPGYSFYFYPVFLYCLGIVNCGTGKFKSYVYTEGEGKKGGNNSCSLLLHYIKNKLMDRTVG